MVGAHLVHVSSIYAICVGKKNRPMEHLVSETSTKVTKVYHLLCEDNCIKKRIKTYSYTT